ncbi:MAG: hypothetical protein JWQ29_584 [Phenylobacterium sp.]|nr:hypothetical protein [Phenylobacterium sp.]
MKGRGRFQGGEDCFHHAAEIAPDFSCPHPDDPEAVPPQNSVADKIMIGLHLIAMLKAIDLNDQVLREAGEIEVVAAEGVLPAEGKPAVAQAPQARPEDDLGFAHIPAKLAGALDLGAHKRYSVLVLFWTQAVSLIFVC